MKRRLALLLLITSVGSSITCGGGSTVAPSGPVNVTGTWSGLLGQPQSGAALRVTWTASQTGNDVVGPATLIKPAVNIPSNGILSGRLTGSQLALTYLAPGGSVQEFPGCSISGNGTATATSTVISGTLTLTFAACVGTGLEPTGSDQLMLTRQQ